MPRKDRSAAFAGPASPGTPGNPATTAAAAAAAARRRKTRSRRTAATPAAGVAVAALVVAAGVWLAAPAWRVGPSAATHRRRRPRAAGAWAPVTGYEVVQTLPHDPTTFTQGLVYAGEDLMFESSGGFGTSSLREVELATGIVRRDTPVRGEPDLFAEGIALRRTGGDQLLLLTWKHERGHVMDLPGTHSEHFQVSSTWKYKGQGWGLATSSDGNSVFMSNGSSVIQKFNAQNLEQAVAHITVTDNDLPIHFLNDLQVVPAADGGADELWANVWFTQLIARIDPKTGKVLAWVDLTGILPPADRKGVDVMNGIAHDPATGRIWVTGKLWPKLFQISLVHTPLKRTVADVAPFLFTREGIDYINKILV